MKKNGLCCKFTWRIARNVGRNSIEASGLTKLERPWDANSSDGAAFCYSCKHMESTGEVLKTGALADVTDLLKRLAGPAVDELGAMLADRIQVYRLQNLLKIGNKTKRIL